MTLILLVQSYLLFVLVDVLDILAQGLVLGVKLQLPVAGKGATSAHDW